MLKKILATVGTRYVIAALNLVLMLINSRVLGRHGMGLAGVVYASANVAVMFASVLCGNTIVYFMRTKRLSVVVSAAYVWALAGSGLACGVMAAVGMLPAGYGWAVFGLAVLLSLVNVHLRVLLGWDRIRAFNAVFLLQGAGLFVVLLGLYYIAGWRDVAGYVWGLYLTNLASWAVSLAVMMRSVTHPLRYAIDARAWLRDVREMFAYGLWSSVDNLAENLSARLNYFFLQRFGGYGSVGLLDVGTRVSESLWHISHGVSFIAYGEITRATDAERQRRLTLRLLPPTMGALTVAMGVVLCIPEWVYTEWLFTPEFTGIRSVIAGLSVGIVAFGGNRILSHYFIGTGRVRVSAACSCVGLALLCASAAVMVPRWGVVGAAGASSVAYVGMFLFSMVAFVRITRKQADA
ncbi:polysaccharide biosynthesis protein [Tannerella sp. oral taxon 808]|nr:polysaccharide biosynthesis protein [Tannerella sp. oral taxon 808]